MPKILLLEDDAALGSGIQLALQGQEVQITLCATLEQARGALNRQTFDLLILDVNLPDGSGLELLAQLRGSGDVPVILLTANDMEMDIVTGLESGADGNSCRSCPKLTPTSSSPWRGRSWALWDAWSSSCC